MITDEQKNKLLEQLKTTPIVQAACQKVGISRASVYRWKKEDPEFNEAFNEALASGTATMNDMAEAQLLSAIRDRNLTAIIFWLKSHHPQYGTRIELSGQLATTTPLTPEQEILLERALEMAGIKTPDAELTTTSYEANE